MTRALHRFSLLPLMTLALLCACGGGGSDASSTDGNPPTPPAPPPDGATSGGYAETSRLYDIEPLEIPSWTADTSYLFGQRVRSNGRIYQMVSRTSPTGGKSATSGTGPSGVGTVPDGDLLWADTGMTAPGTVYYVCDCEPETGADRSNPAAGCVNGDDSRSEQEAQNPATPWKTLEHALAKFRTMRAGDTIALSRGGVFTVRSDRVNNSNSRLDNGCTIRDYDPAWFQGPGRAPLPILEPSAVYAGTHVGLFITQGQGIRLLNLRVRRPSGVAKSVGVAMSLDGNNIPGTMLANVAVENFVNGVVDNCGVDGFLRTTDTVIAGCRIIHNSDQGIMMGGNGTILDSNYFDQNGYAAAQEGNRLHSIYMSVHSDEPASVRITRNEIYRNVIDGRPTVGSDPNPEYNKCVGSDIVLHGRFDGVRIENNLIDNTGIAGGGCYGIELSPGGYPDLVSEYFKTVRIDGNRIYGIGAKGIAADMCTDCLIENNVIWVDGPGSAGVFAIAAPSLVAGDRNDPAHYPRSERITTRNNSIYFTATGGPMNSQGIRAINDQGGSGHLITNNAISWRGTPGAFIGVHAEAGATAAGNVVQNRTVPTDPDPGFKDPENKDFTLQATSDLVDAGSTASGHASSEDITGKARDARPDVGAYEY